MSKNGPWAVPRHWEWFSIGDKTEVVGGGTPSTRDDANYEQGTIPWITPADLSGYKEKYIQRGRRNITEKGLNGSGARLMPEGTVLFSSRAPIGYVAIASNPVTTNQGFKSFVPQDDVVPEYLYYYLQRAKCLALSLASGTTFPEISGKNARKIPLPLPSTDEQKKIVEAVETQFARLDDAVAALQRSRTRLKRYRASVLNAACEGRLVPTEAELARQEGRGYEPASALLERIKAEREAEPGKKRGRIASLAASPLPELPEGWAWSVLDDLLLVLRNGLSEKPDPEGGTPILRISAVRPLSLDLSQMRYLKTSLEEVEKYILQTGDILFTRYNGNPDLVGVCAIVENLPSATVHPDKLIAGQFAEVDPNCMAILASAGYSRMHIRSKVKTTAGQAGISGADIKKTPIPVPPFAEQKRIVEEVERRLSVIDRMEATVEMNLKRAESLRQSILRMAFSGRLLSSQDESSTLAVS